MAVLAHTRITHSTPVDAPPQRRIAGIAASIGAAATVVSAIGSWTPSLWGDEAASVLSAQRSIPSLFRMLSHVDAVHGTYYVLLHFWIKVFGSSPFSVRLPSAIAVGLMVAALVVLADRLGGRRVAIVAGIIAAVLPRTTYMGEEARGYALSAACVTWLAVVLVTQVQRRQLDRPHQSARTLWLVYAIGVALSAYVFLFSLLVLIAHAVVILLARDRALTLRWLRATGLGLILALPVIVYGTAESGQIGFLANRTAATFISSTVTPWFGERMLATFAWALILTAVSLSIGSWIRRRRNPSTLAAVTSRRGVSPLVLGLVWAVAPLVVLLGVNIVHAVYSSRYMSFAAPGAVLVIAWLIARFRSLWVVVVATLVFALLASTSYFSHRTPYAKNASDWAEIAATIKAHASRGDAVVFDETERPSRRTRLAMRTYPAAFTGLQDVGLATPWWQTDTWYDTAYPESQLPSLTSDVSTIWLIEYRVHGQAADTYARATLAAEGFTVAASWDQYSSETLELARAAQP